MTKLKNSKCDKTQDSKYEETQIVTKLKNSNVTQLKNSRSLVMVNIVFRTLKKAQMEDLSIGATICTRQEMQCLLYMAQISEGGEDSEGMSYFLKLWDLNLTRNDLLCILGLLLQFNDTNASMDLEQN